jgi:hypothetical protein
LAFIVQEQKQGDTSRFMEIKIEGPYFEKATICVPILPSLPAWFGIEEAIIRYSTEIDHLPTLLAYEAVHVVGFVSLKQHRPYAAEAYVMGMLPASHRKGIGRALIKQSDEWLKNRDIEYLQVI